MNRRMPNGMYGGVRGEGKSPLLDYFYTKMYISRDLILPEEKLSGKIERKSRKIIRENKN